MNKKTLYIIGGSLAGITVAYFIYDIIKTKRNKSFGTNVNPSDVEISKPNNSSDNNTNNNTSDSNINNELGVTQISEGSYKSNRSILVGDKGQRIYVLQSALNTLGASLVLDGKYGAGTYDAVYEYGDEWTVFCKYGYACGLLPSEYNNIISKAEGFGWSKQNALNESKSLYSS